MSQKSSCRRSQTHEGEPGQPPAGDSARLVNKTFEVREELWWGEGTACASDAKKFGSIESNLMTEWHARYGGPGVMIYWHVEKRACASTRS